MLARRPAVPVLHVPLRVVRHARSGCSSGSSPRRASRTSSRTRTRRVPRRLRDVTPRGRRRSTQVNSFATDDLKKLFLFRPHTASDLHDELQCPVCTGKIAAKRIEAREAARTCCPAKAAQRCLEVLQASLLKDDADAKKRLSHPFLRRVTNCTVPWTKNAGRRRSPTPILGVCSQS